MKKFLWGSAVFATAFSLVHMTLQVHGKLVDDRWMTNASVGVSIGWAGLLWLAYIGTLLREFSASRKDAQPKSLSESEAAADLARK